MTSTASPPRPAGSRVETDLSWAVDRLVGRPLSSHTDEELADRLQRKQRQRSRDVAEEAELILALAGQRPASQDPPPGRPGARRPGWTPQAASDEVSEFFTAELATVLNVGRGTAAIKLARALTWAGKLPLTFAALRAGELDERRANALADALEHVCAEIAGRVEDALLGQAGNLSVYKLRDRVAALILQFDAAAAEEAPQGGGEGRRREAVPLFGPVPGPALSLRRVGRTGSFSWSTSWRRCSRPTATPGRSGSCGRTCCRC